MRSVKVKDFRIDRRDDGKWYCFRFVMGEEGFMEALAAVKRKVPLGDREYHPDRQHEWAVRAEYAPWLEEVFENWRQCVEAAEAQIPLPL